MKRKDYEKPTTRSIELRYRAMLLQMSGPVQEDDFENTIDDWDDGGTEEEEIYM